MCDVKVILIYEFQLKLLLHRSQHVVSAIQNQTVIKIITVYSENHTKQINKIPELITEFLNFKAGST
jgi:hypothetical protein